MRRLRCGLTALLLAATASAQDFPVDVPGTTPTAPPPGIAKPGEPAPPAVQLITPFALLDRVVAPGTRMTLEWRPKGGIAASEIPSPVIVAHGAKAGPVLCLTAGVHGDEINGVEIVRRLAHGVDPAQLSGTVIGVPIVNVFGYSRGSRYLPDRRDLNRHFPGTQYGSIASRIAHSFFNELIRRCDWLVDFHTGSFERSNLPQVRADLTNGHVLEFTRGFGATLILHSKGSKGMLRVAAAEAGIPAVAFEVGSPGQLEMAGIAQAESSLLRLMHALQMRDGGPQQDEGPQAIFFDSSWVRSNSGGLLVGEVTLGQRVQQGQRLGRVIDPVSNLEREIVASFPGRVIGIAQNRQVLPGFAAFHIGRETSEQQAVTEASTNPGADAVAEDPSERPEDMEGDEEFE